MHLDNLPGTGVGDYQKYTRRKTVFILFLCGLTAALFFLGIVIGAMTLSVQDVISSLVSPAESNASLIVWSIRLPRVIAALVAGAGLAAAGVVMQSVLRNPLSSPYTLGISHAAGFGAAFAITALGAGTLSHNIADAVTVRNPYIITICAFAGSMLATAALLLVARYRNSRPEVIILLGVALAALFTAGTTFLQYFSSADQVAAIVFWTFGDVGRATWGDLAIIALVVIPSIAYFVYSRWDYNAIDAGDDAAQGLGVNVERSRTVGMFLGSLITAVVVSFMGIIGFIGLLGPHMVRAIVGSDHRYLLPAACLMGSILLLAADQVARVIIAPATLPVGVLTAFLGAPLFIWLVLGRQRL
ncbi:MULTISPECIES: iron ABC transporter permease [unclassified Methanoregula]|uniref:FecCD family ABC transporter permease n=1 Tax=unclassified Methanoregula TaxID=2649730 RepID=UPI0009CA1698|nr:MULTISPECIES: iron ABC transporter permease [unclassified Methanoregula]OPX64377.1 MAG: Cobalamin import system permease protein BtuC [Methanoregula sp. PtaB.Bin085]OPY34953.1 MAG: Cobalamin import system permease protein BtuC [Methanoregula sp. PtaU1.Bin006]